MSSTPGIPAGAVPPELLSRFMALFQGYQKAFGVFYPSGKIEPRTNKVLGRAATERGTPTAQRFEGHLLGQTGLGIVIDRKSVV